jgi:hypothetical protein
VRTEIEIGRPRGEVAAFAAAPDNATRWYANITAVEWKSEPPLAVGSQIASVARFLVDGSSTPTRSARTYPASYW